MTEIRCLLCGSKIKGSNFCKNCIKRRSMEARLKVLSERQKQRWFETRQEYDSRKPKRLNISLS